MHEMLWYFKEHGHKSQNSDESLRYCRGKMSRGVTNYILITVLSTSGADFECISVLNNSEIAGVSVLAS